MGCGASVPVAGGPVSAQQPKPKPKPSTVSAQAHPASTTPAAPPSAPAAVTSPTPAPANKSKALIIGIDYPGSAIALNGCAADAKRFSNILVNLCGWSQTNIRLVTDPVSVEGAPIPTRDVLLKEITALTADVKAGDHLVFFYAGHGGQSKDLTGEEADGLDECLVPSGTKSQADYIKDDELYQLLTSRVPAGAAFTAIVDACHSGTMFDLAVNMNCQLPETPDAAASFSVDKGSWHDEISALKCGALVLMSAARDAQVAMETANSTGTTSGVFTVSLEEALSAAKAANTNLSFKELLLTVNQNIARRGMAQRSQLSASAEGLFGEPVSLGPAAAATRGIAAGIVVHD